MSIADAGTMILPLLDEFSTDVWAYVLPGKRP